MYFWNESVKPLVLCRRIRSLTSLAPNYFYHFYFSKWSRLNHHLQLQLSLPTSNSFPSRPAFAEVQCRTLPLGADITSEGQINEGAGCYIFRRIYRKSLQTRPLPNWCQSSFINYFDPSSCSIIWENSTGEEANLVDENGNPATFTLDETNATKPPNGTYTSAFIVIDPTVKLKATWLIMNHGWQLLTTRTQRQQR